MAHMWFGDMVTMRWWDDLWLNESFAEWACGWAAVGCTEFTDMWAGMLATEKQDAYAADAAPTTHPIRQELADVATAQASFDDITYPKGAAVLKQLVAYVGEDGLRRRAAQLLPQARLGEHHPRRPGRGGRRRQWSRPDRPGWRAGWRLPAPTVSPSSVEDDGLTLVATPPAGRGPLPHQLRIGAYADRGDELALVETLSVEVTGERTRIEPRRRGRPVAGQRRRPDLRRPCAPTRRPCDLLLSRGGHLPTAVGRTLAVTTAWGLLYDGELTAQQFVDCGVHVLRHETADSVIEPLLSRLVEAADLWAPPSARDGLLSQVADLCVVPGERPGPSRGGASGAGAERHHAGAARRCSPRRRPTPTSAGAGSPGSPSWTGSTTPTWTACWPRTPTRTPG